MKASLKVFAAAVMFMAVSGSLHSQNHEFKQVEEPVDGGYSCTVTTNCFNIGGKVSGTVGCTGTKKCERGTGYVECDGKRTSC